MALVAALGGALHLVGVDRRCAGRDVTRHWALGDLARRRRRWTRGGDDGGTRDEDWHSDASDRSWDEERCAGLDSDPGSRGRARASEDDSENRKRQD